MTSPDIPDWEGLTTPAYAPAVTSNVGALVDTTITGLIPPFRIWALWISAVVSTSSTYAGGGYYSGVRIVDTNGTLYMELALNVRGANQQDGRVLSLPFYGIRPSLSGGLAQLRIQTDVGQVNTVLHASAGAIISRD